MSYFEVEAAYKEWCNAAQHLKTALEETYPKGTRGV